jgi:hypothetical protein
MQKYAASLGGESALEAKRRGRNGEGETARAKRWGRNVPISALMEIFEHL